MTEEAKNSIHPSVQFLLLFVILIGCMFAGGGLWFVAIWALYGFDVITNTIAFNTTAPHVLTSIWIFQILTTTTPVFVAPYILGKRIVQQPVEYLKAKTPNPLILLLVVLVIMFSFTPLMEWLVTTNQKMVLPKFLSGVEKWMRESEANAIKETTLLLKFNSVWQMLWALLVIGLLTAVAEEFLFRGAVQAIFTRWTNNPHMGIWIAAILFSAIHLQFFGFFPRMVLGVFFGYFVWWSGSIWTSIWAHFINNGTAVIVSYLFQQKVITTDPDADHAFNLGIYAFSLIITVLLFILYRKLTLTQKQIPQQL